MNYNQINDNILSTIGNTPLIKLKGPSEITGCTILGKAEYANPGQSVKDRAALSIIQKALERKDIETGGMIVEGTAGNTGIGLTIVANVLGLKTTIVIPKTQSEEKKMTLRLLGAELIEVPAVPYKDDNNYVHYSRRLAKTLAEKSSKGVFWANQFDNIDNQLAHYETTAAEIIRDTEGAIDGFICAVGTGGTLAGTAKRLREDKKNNIAIGLADPMGAALYNYYTCGDLKASNGDSIAEGIGQGRITGNLEGLKVDFVTQVDDNEALPIIFDLLYKEGICLGTSSAINILGAMRMAKELGKNKTIVTILCDYGTRYASKLYNTHFLRQKGLPLPSWLT